MRLFSLFNAMTDAGICFYSFSLRNLSLLLRLGFSIRAIEFNFQAERLFDFSQLIPVICGDPLLCLGRTANENDTFTLANLQWPEPLLNLIAVHSLLRFDQKLFTKLIIWHSKR